VLSAADTDDLNGYVHDRRVRFHDESDGVLLVFFEVFYEKIDLDAPGVS
jgi:hypothetical protein